MELFILEHKKLWSRKSVKISVLLCFTYVVLLGCILYFQWFGFGSSSDHTSPYGNNFDGYFMIRESQEYAKEFGGVLTDETLQQLVRDYQRMEAEGLERELEKTDWQVINNWLANLWPELKNPDSYQLMISYVQPEKLTGFYERRQQAIEEFLENNSQTGPEKEYLMELERKAEKPFRYQWVNGWWQLVGGTIAELGDVMALLIAIVLSSMFAGEWHDNTGFLVLTTKNGWEKTAGAKILAGIVFTIELFSMLAISITIAQIFFFGTDGWDIPIQSIKIQAIGPMNMLQAEIYEYAFTILGAIGYAGVVMLISAAVKNHVLALIISLFVVYSPTIIGRYLPYELQKVLDLIPLAGSGADIFRTNTFEVFGHFIWSPYLLITVPVLIGVVCMPVAVKCWARRGKI